MQFFHHLACIQHKYLLECVWHSLHVLHKWVQCLLQYVSASLKILVVALHAIHPEWVKKKLNYCTTVPIPMYSTHISSHQFIFHLGGMP